MKKHKIFLLTCIYCFFSIGSNAQNNICINAAIDDFDILFSSQELTTVNGNFDIPVKVVSLQDQVFGGTFLTRTPNDDPFFNINISPDPTTLTNTLFNLGDTIDFTFNITYNQNNLPFGYREITAVIPGTNGRITQRVYIYFTPYNTIEIWNGEDFVNLKRVWFPPIAVGSDLDTQRIFIDRDSIPVSDLPDLPDIPDSSVIDESTDTIEINTFVIPGLGYGIPMLAAIIDTEDIVDQSFKTAKKKTFRGQIQNVRVYTWYINDANQWVKIGLRNAVIEIKRAKTFNSKVLATAATDDEGFIVNSSGSRTVTFTHKSRKKKIKIFINVVMKRTNNSIKVKKGGSVRTIEIETGRLKLSPSSSFTTLNFGDITPGSHRGGKQLTWTSWAWDKTNQELAAVNETGFRDVTIVMRKNNTTSEMNYKVFRKIWIGSDDRDKESTMWHEFGHWVQQDIQNGHSAPNTISVHSVCVDNKSPQQTISEGWAEGYAYIMDEIMFFLDGEANGNSTFSNGNHLPFDFSDCTDPAGLLSHEYTSERTYSRLLLDLWDGPNNYAKFGYTNNTVLPNLSGHYDDDGIDHFEIPLVEILRPFFEHRQNKFRVIQDVVQYYIALKRSGEDCDFNVGLSRIWRLNTYRELGIDGIDLLHRTVTHNRYKHSDKDGWEFKETYNYHYFITDINILDGSNLSFNLGAPSSTNLHLLPGISLTLSQLTKVVDPLLIRNGAILSFNKNVRVHKVNNSLQTFFINGQFGAIDIDPPIENTNQDFTICGRTIVEVEDNGAIELGDPTISNTADVRVKDGCLVRFRANGDLIVHDGSNFIFEAGATLYIQSGANIQVEGDGKITMETGSFLCVQSGATINLQDAQSTFVVQDNINIGTNPELDITGTGCLSLCQIQGLVTGNGSLSRTKIADAGENIIFCVSSSNVSGYTIGGDPTGFGGSGNYTFLWSPATDLDDNTKSNPTVVTPITSTTTYQVTVIDLDFGCDDTDEMTIFINPDNPGTLGLLSNAHLENQTVGNPDSWDAFQKSPDVAFLDDLSIETPLSGISSADPAPGSGCSDANLPLSTNISSYFAQLGINQSLSANTVYLFAPQIKVINTTSPGNKDINISLTSELTPGGLIRKWELNEGFPLNPPGGEGGPQAAGPGGPNDVLRDFIAHISCFATDRYFSTANLKNIGVRFFTDYTPASTDLDVHIDALRLELITSYIDPVSNLNYVVQNLTNSTNTGVKDPLLGNNVFYFNNTINASTFSQATQTNRVYNVEQFGTNASNEAPRWNLITRYNYDATVDRIIDGIIVMQPFTHIRIVNKGDLGISLNGVLCMGHGAEFIVPSGCTFIYGGGKIQMNSTANCLGLFGGGLKILENQNMNINTGFIFQFQQSRISMEKGSQLTFNRTGKLYHHSGARIKLDKDRTLLFEKGSDIVVADNSNPNPLTDKRLRIILNCGELITKWEGSETTDKLQKINVLHTWKHIRDCKNKIYPTLPLKILTEPGDTIIMNKPIDFTEFQNVVVTGRGNVKFTSFPEDIKVSTNTVLRIIPDFSRDLTIESGLILDSNSTTIIGGNTIIRVNNRKTLHIKANANLTLTANVQIIVEADGFICIEPGANISILQNAQFIVDPNAILGVNPLLDTSNTCKPDIDFSDAQFDFVQTSCGVGGVIADGSESKVGTSHTWSVTELETGLTIEETFSTGVVSNSFDFIGGNFGGGFDFQAGKFYEIKLILTDGNSQSTKKELIQINPPLSIIENLAICLGDTAQLLAEAGDNVTFQWAVSPTLIGENFANPIVFPDFNTTYIVTVQDLDGCTVTDSVSITVIRTDEVITIAGTGDSAFAEGDALTQTKFKFPSNVAVSNDGRFLYITDEHNHVIRRLDFKTDSVTVFTGKPENPGFVDGSLDNARFNHPKGIYIDKIDNIYVTDEQNHSIRRIDPVIGQVTTIAGNGSPGLTNGLGTIAKFDRPQGICIDNETRTIYVADAQNNVIRLLRPNTFIEAVTALDWVVETFAGTGVEGFKDGNALSQARFKHPSNVNVDSLGNVYVADEQNHSIRKIDPITNQVTTIAGNGKLGYKDGDVSTARFKFPQGVVVDKSGKVYVSDRLNYRIRVIDQTTNQVSTLAGTGVHPGLVDGDNLTVAKFKQSEGITLDPSGNILYIADRHNHAIRRIVINCDIDLPPIDFQLNNSQNSGLRISIFPNPFSDNTTIELDIPDSFNSPTLIITDIAGKIIKQYKLKNGINKITVSGTDLKDGIYFLNVRSDGNLKGSGKMILIH